MASYYGHVQALIKESETPPRAVVFDSSAWYQLDLTSTDMLKKLVQVLRGKGMCLSLSTAAKWDCSRG